MADFTWTDVLQNPGQFPDALEIDMGEGRGSVRLGDLRATVARQAGQWRQQADVYAAEKAALEEKLAYALAHPDPADPRREASPTTQPIDYSADPILRPLYQAAVEAKTLASTNDAKLTEMMKLQQQLLQNLGQIPGMMRLEQLRAVDPGLDPAQLVEYMRQKRQQPVDVADYYKLMTYDQQLAKAKELGKTEGKQEAEQAAQLAPAVPYAPYGPAQSVALPHPAFASLDEAEQALLQDRDIVQTFYAGGSA